VISEIVGDGKRMKEEVTLWVGDGTEVRGSKCCHDISGPGFAITPQKYAI